MCGGHRCQVGLFVFPQEGAIVLVRTMTTLSFDELAQTELPGQRGVIEPVDRLRAKESILCCSHLVHASKVTAELAQMSEDVQRWKNHNDSVWGIDSKFFQSLLDFLRGKSLQESTCNVNAPRLEGLRWVRGTWC